MTDDSTRLPDRARKLIDGALVVPTDEGRAGGIEVADGIREDDLRLLDAVNHELALDASDDPSPNTPEEDEADADLLARAQRTMAMSPEQVARARRGG
jgi:hypothetical protein